MWAVTQDVSSAALANIKDSAHLNQNVQIRSPGYSTSSLDKLPDKIILKIFSYLPHCEIGRLARVCRKWRMIACDSRLWTHVSLRPEVSGLHVSSLETLLALISMRPSLRYIELPIELITHTVLHELANKCVNLSSMLLDFSTAMQLHDFNDLHSFPTKLRTMCICLSEVIFMEGFMRKIYNFINGLEVLHLIGTYEKAVEDEEEEIYEVVNIHKLKSAIPNLRVVNLFGINFVDDSHVESLSSNCIQLECLALNFCVKFTGSVLRVLFNRCKRLRSLLLQHTNLQDEHLMNVDWEKTSLSELDITASELSSECLINVLCRIPALRYLSAGQQDGFTDVVLKEYMDKGNTKQLIAIDLDRNENLSEEMLLKFLKQQAFNCKGLQLSGIPHLTEQFWITIIPMLKNIKILVLGMPEGCCQKIYQKIHIDSLIDSIANNCPEIERLEIRWDPETMRFSDRSNKAVDSIRLKCLRLRCWCLSDGKYFEMVKSNFERADRATVVRSTTNCRVTLVYLLSHYKDLIFN
ncbi:F-box/LRR-repeat protein 7 [Sarcoptes scabiei]|nr:F-box/LRR-repeat protein 7 [Sarcoptes scabiei]